MNSLERSKKMAKSKSNLLMPAGIRNKLLAAVSMLMVSSVMMVSTTYAWFTLSSKAKLLESRNLYKFCTLYLEENYRALSVSIF